MKKQCLALLLTCVMGVTCVCATLTSCGNSTSSENSSEVDQSVEEVALSKPADEKDLPIEAEILDYEIISPNVFVVYAHFENKSDKDLSFFMLGGKIKIFQNGVECQGLYSIQSPKVDEYGPIIDQHADVMSGYGANIREAKGLSNLTDDVVVKIICDDGVVAQEEIKISDMKLS